jgi:hypothetical protein
VVYYSSTGSTNAHLDPSLYHKGGDMDANEIVYLRNLIDQHKQRLRALELKAAFFGANVPAEILLEKSDIETKIAGLEQKLGTTPYQDNAPEIPPELTAGFALRYNRLSTKLKDILAFIENESLNTGQITQRVIGARFSEYPGAELFYRLEYLYLLGFLEKRLVDSKSKTDNFDYSLSSAYRRYKEEEDRLRVA